MIPADLDALIAELRAEAEGVVHLSVNQLKLEDMLEWRAAAALAALRAEVSASDDRASRLAGYLDESEQQIAALRADAERYRWLRTFGRKRIVVTAFDPAEGDTMYFDSELDAAIDAAREEKP